MWICWSLVERSSIVAWRCTIHGRASTRRRSLDQLQAQQKPGHPPLSWHKVNIVLVIFTVILHPFLYLAATLVADLSKWCIATLHVIQIIKFANFAFFIHYWRESLAIKHISFIIEGRVWQLCIFHSLYKGKFGNFAYFIHYIRESGKFAYFIHYIR